MKTLYITTTRENMEDDELASTAVSTIFTLPVAVAGMKKLLFRER
ncbi:SMP-30/gluconolactonase/LRE family protein [Klebsiella variicola]|nr:SMP-30/gluconolactonase/LRE family protein [Klebsiella variicola]